MPKELESMNDKQEHLPAYLSLCTTCGKKTSKAYAAAHAGECKKCVLGEDYAPSRPLPVRQLREDEASPDDGLYQI